MSLRKMQKTDEELVWTCQYCGVHNPLWADLTIPGKQDMVEECRICCRPNRIIIYQDEEGEPYCEARLTDE